MKVEREDYFGYTSDGGEFLLENVGGIWFGVGFFGDAPPARFRTR